MKDMTGKVAFVTGGASGIGLAMARSFSAAGMGIGSRRCVSENADNPQYVKLLTIGDKLSRCGANAGSAERGQ
jgi:NAD(P)-dependent dehydrogenase (short-subunit alcohol dehydrogenase family)